MPELVAPLGAPEGEPAPHARLDALSREAAEQELLRCCGSSRWVRSMLEERPFGSALGLADAARAAFRALEPSDYLEAFAHHPPIGENLASLRARFAGTAAWSSTEQAGVNGADEATLVALAAENHAYRERFGFVFLICATGKTAAEMLTALRARLPNDPDEELRIATGELQKITALRLARLAPAPAREQETAR